MNYSRSFLTPLNRIPAFAVDCPQRSVAALTAGAYIASRSLIIAGSKGEISSASSSLCSDSNPITGLV